jgi:riboflavin kinase/FMN adenylyltransferase
MTKIIDSFATIPREEGPFAMMIGNYDGMHLGHQSLFQQLKKIAQSTHCKSVVVTFKNHPSLVLRPECPVQLLCTFEHKVKLIEAQGIDVLIPLTFTKEFSHQTAEQFLNEVRKHCSFSHLILGFDSVLGKDRHGDKPHLFKVAKEQGFSLTYLDEIKLDGEKISSSKIRECIRQGNFDHAEKMLGRRYSIYTSIKSGEGLGKRIGFPTLNMDVGGLCLPPLGVYAVKVIHENAMLDGVANLGIAPTVRQNPEPILEVHLLESVAKIDWIEVVFIQFLRPEIRFENIDRLKEQIGKDVEQAHNILAFYSKKRAN